MDESNPKSDDVLLQSTEDTSATNLLPTYSIDSRILQRGYEAAARYYTKIDKLFQYSNIILTSTITLLASYEYSSNGKENKSIVLAVAIIGLISTILQRMRESSETPRKSHTFHGISNNFSQIASDINLFLHQSYTEEDLRECERLQHDRLAIFKNLATDLPRRFELIGQQYVAKETQLLRNIKLNS